MTTCCKTRRTGPLLPAAISALVALTVMCFLLLVFEGAAIASAFRFGNPGTTVTVTVDRSGKTPLKTSDRSSNDFLGQVRSFARDHDLSLAWTAGDGSGIVGIADEKGRFRGRSVFAERLNESGSSRVVLLSSALVDSDKAARDSVFGREEAPLTVVGRFDPVVRFGQHYPAAIVPFDVLAPAGGTWVFAGDHDETADVKEFFSTKGIKTTSVVTAGPRSGANFAASTNGKFSSFAAVFLLFVGVLTALGRIHERSRRHMLGFFISTFIGSLIGIGVVLVAWWTFLHHALILGSGVNRGLAMALGVGGATLGACTLIWAILTIIIGFIRRKPSPDTPFDSAALHAPNDSGSIVAFGSKGGHMVRGLMGDVFRYPIRTAIVMAGAFVMTVAVTTAGGTVGLEVREVVNAAEQAPLSVSHIRTTGHPPGTGAQTAADAERVLYDAMAHDTRLDMTLPLDTFTGIATPGTVVVTAASPINSQITIPDGSAVVWGNVADIPLKDGTLRGLNVTVAGTHSRVLNLIGGNGYPTIPDGLPIVVVNPTTWRNHAAAIPSYDTLVKAVTCHCSVGDLTQVTQSMTQAGSGEVHYFAESGTGVYGPPERSSAVAAVVTVLLYVGGLAVALLAAIILGQSMWKRRMRSYMKLPTTGAAGLRRQLYTLITFTIPVAAGFALTLPDVGNSYHPRTLLAGDVWWAIVAMIIAHVLVALPGLKDVAYIAGLRRRYRTLLSSATPAANT